MQAHSNGRKAPQHRNSSVDTPKWEIARALVASQESTDALVNEVATKEGKPRGLNITLSCGLPSFLPGSELPKGIKQEALVGTTIKVKVIEANRRKGRLISSHKTAANEDKAAYLGSLTEEQEVVGTVARITDFGYFIALGVVDGLLHNSQTALVEGKPEVLTKGQTVTCRVRSVNLEKGEVGLTMRKPRPAGGGRHGNTEAFNNRYGNRGSKTPTVSVKSFTSTAPAKPQTPRGPRKLNTGGGKKRKNAFTVSFEGGVGADGRYLSPFEQLAAHFAGNQTPEATAPAEATTADAQ